MLTVILSLAGCFLIPPNFDEAFNPSDTTLTIFEVPSGSSGYRIGELIQEAGYIEKSDDFKWYLKHRQTNNCLKAGRFELSPSMTIPQIIEVLCGPPRPDDVPFTVIEGWRIREIDEALANEGFAEAGEYTAAANNIAQFNLPQAFPEQIASLEGYLFPETYRIEPDRFTVEAFIQRQIDTFDAQFLEPAGASVDHRGLHNVVIMASMIEREEPDDGLMPMVSGILWKRLENNWNLGVDATSRYTIEVWNDRRAFLAKLRDPDDPYNTRLRSGLPPTAIGNPGIKALNAALNPEPSPYWYYLHDSNGRNHPARSAAEHEANRRRYNVY